VTDREFTARAQQAITEVAGREPNLKIESVHLTRGWGDILFVRVHARLSGRSAQEHVEHAFLEAVREALPGQRSTVSVTWSW